MKIVLNVQHVVSVAWTDARVFNLMFKTYQGVTEDSSSIVYLRPETAQVSLSTSKMF